MRMEDEDELVNRAAAAVRAMVAELGVGAPAGVARVLAHLRDHALDRDYSVKVLKKQLRICGNDLMVEHSRWVGVSPWRLIGEVRMVTTAVLLRSTDLDVDTIAWRVGYRETKSLRRAFQSWCGMSPTEYRERSRQAESLAGPPPARALSLLFWRRLYAGTMEPEEVAQVLAYLEKLASLPEDADAGGEGDAFMASLTAELSTMLDSLPWLDQREAARYEIRCASPYWYEHLSARSRAAARRGELERAAQLAELALDSLEATEELLGVPDPRRRAVAWARLALARHRAGAAAEAEQASLSLEQTLAEIPADGRDVDLEAERLFAHAELCAAQGRDARALELAGELVGLTPVPRTLAGRARLLRARLGLRAGADGADDRRTAEVGVELAAARELLEAVEPASERAEPLAELFDLWARTHARRGGVDEVERAKGRLRALAAELDTADGALASRRARWASRSWQAWVDRRLGDLSGAERGWQRARTGFAELGDTARSASITAELVVLALERGRGDQASAWTRELLAQVAACGVSRAELPALAALSRAAASTRVGVEELEPVRRSLERLF